MDTKSARILGACIIVAALIVSLVPRLTRGSAGAAHGIHSADGRLEVGYMVQTSPTTTEGATMGRVTDIEFCPNYVVVRTQDGRGRVFFSERTQRLDWFLKPPPPPPVDGHDKPVAKPAAETSKPGTAVKK